MKTNKKVFVTGGAGYIGSHVVKALNKEGYTTLAYDSLENGYKEAVLDTNLVIGNLSNKTLLIETLKRFKPDLVMHLAAYASVPDSVSNPLEYYDNNIINGLHLLNAMRDADVQKMVFSSSAAVYGQPDVDLISENVAKKPTNPYGRSKLHFEEILSDCDVAYGLKSVSLRYFCAAGGDSEGLIGESHKPESHLIPVVLRSILGIVDSIKICGTDYPTKDGTGVRDYIHVEDLADAHIRSMKYLFEAGNTNQFNVGIGEGYSVREIIRVAEKISGMKVPYEDAPRRPGDPASLVADSSRIQKELGWKAKNDLNSIINTAWMWFKKHPNGFEN